LKRDTVNYLVVGLFVSAALAAFFTLMFFVTGRSGPSDRYYAFYENVTGIKFGTGVFYEGYRVGQVEDVAPVPAPNGMRYKVSLSVAEDWRIPRDSVAEVVAAGIIAQVQIQIREGRSTEHLAPGDEIQGLQQVDLFSALSEAATGFTDLSASGVAPVLRNLNKRISQIAEEFSAFRHDELGPLVRNLDRRLNGELAPQAAQVLARLDANSQSLERILGTPNEQRITRFLTHIDDAALNLQQLITGLDSTRVQLDGTLKRLDQLAESNTEDLSQAVRSARIALDKMAATATVINEDIDTVMYNVDGGARQMHELARALRENPTRILRTPSTAAPP
jgi:phospholipid/cholesterol/gamma-HCH transport system substrate-binding protein